MLIYDDVEQLVADMFHTIEVDEDVISVVADKDLISQIMQEMLTYEDVTIDYCNIDSFAYDKEYLVSLSYDGNDECWYICVDQIYNDNKEKYNSMGGYVLFHEDVNSKALIDIQNNEMSFLTGHDWFVIGEDDSFVTDDEDVTDEETGVTEKKSSFVDNPTVNNSVNYYVNDEKVNKKIYDKASYEFDRLYHDAFDDFLSKHTRLVDFVYGFPRRFWI